MCSPISCSGLLQHLLLLHHVHVLLLLLLVLLFRDTHSCGVAIKLIVGCGICGNCCTTILAHPDQSLPLIFCCASTIVFPLSCPKCVHHLPARICSYFSYKYSMCMYLNCCPWHGPTIDNILCCIHLINAWISEVVVVVLHLILPFHSMVFLFSFVLLLF